MSLRRVTNTVSAEVIESADGLTVKEVVLDQTGPRTRVFTDEHRGYQRLPNHQTVKHSVGEYVDGMAHTNAIESFWSLLKRGYKGTYHKMSAKHLQRYVNEFAGRHNVRSRDTLEQMAAIARADSLGSGCGSRTSSARRTWTCPRAVAATCSRHPPQPSPYDADES